jgi:hypothetical protein
MTKLLYKMKDSAPHNSHSDLFLEAASVFHWATKRHFLLWFTGKEAKRDRRTEIVLRRLSMRGKLRAIRYGKKLIYALPRKTKGESGLGKVVHGLSCTECLVRIFRSKMECEVIPERFFFGMGAVPEWGIIYPNRKMILFEFCTKHNFYFSGNLRGKYRAYAEHLSDIEERFKAQAIVLFVCDVHRSAVEREVGSVADGEQSALYDGGSPRAPFYFCDYETFLRVPIGNQLDAKIYFYTDGNVYPLRKND